MNTRSVHSMVSARRVSLASLAFTLGIVTGCGSTTEASPDDPGEGEVGSTQQAFDQIFGEPHPFGTGEAWPCSDEQRAELLAWDAREIDVKCSLTLERDEVIRRPLRFRAGSSGVVIDCQDHLRSADALPSISSLEDTDAIRIASDYPFPFEVGANGMYVVNSRPENIQIRNCTIAGSVSILGIRRNEDGNNGNLRHHVVGSHDTFDGVDHGHPLYVARARALAPTNILFENVTFQAPTDTALYVNPGVTRVTIVNSVFEGPTFEDVGIYLDAESTETTILNSTLKVRSQKMTPAAQLAWWDTFGREQVAVDASSYNFLVGNRVSGLNTGGYNLYRNCGERGGIRYSTPSYNVIVNNEFVYKNYHLSNASRNRYAVHLSSRNGPLSKHHNYCSDDLKLPDGSGTDTNFPTDIDTSHARNEDFAHDNIVTNNEFLNRSPKHYVKNSHVVYNFTALNREVSEFSGDKKACYSEKSFGRVLMDGNKEFVPWMVNDVPACAKLECHDGVLDVQEGLPCPPENAPIQVGCKTRDNNNGCSTVQSCPVGKRVKSVKAVCNLETDSVTPAQLASVPAGNVRIATQSDNVKDGKCYVLSSATSSGTWPITIQQMASYPNHLPLPNGGTLQQMIDVPTENGVRTVNVGCIEKDRTGGDCAVLAEFTCEDYPEAPRAPIAE